MDGAGDPRKTKLNEEAKMRNGMILAVLATCLGWASPAQSQDEFQWSGALSSGDILRIKGISGDVRATLSSGSTVRVEARKRGRDRDFDDVRVLVDEESDGVTLCVIYGRRDVDDCDSRRGWDHDDDQRNIRVSVDFEVQVPSGVEFRPSMVSGDIRAQSLESDVYASTVSGDIDVSTSGIVEAKSVSGSIEAEMGATELQDLEFNTVSGDITLYLSEDVDADIRSSSLSGDFDTEIPVEISRRRDGWVGSTVRGQIGEGGPRLRFETVSGDVTLRRRR